MAAYAQKFSAKRQLFAQQHRQKTKGEEKKKK